MPTASNTATLSSRDHAELCRLMQELNELATDLLPLVNSPVTYDDRRVFDGCRQVAVTSLRAIEILGVGNC